MTDRTDWGCTVLEFILDVLDFTLKTMNVNLTVAPEEGLWVTRSIRTSKCYTESLLILSYFSLDQMAPNWQCNS